MQLDNNEGYEHPQETPDETPESPQQNPESMFPVAGPEYHAENGHIPFFETGLNFKILPNKDAPQSDFNQEHSFGAAYWKSEGTNHSDLQFTVSSAIIEAAFRLRTEETGVNKASLLKGIYQDLQNNVASIEAQISSINQAKKKLDGLKPPAETKAPEPGSPEAILAGIKAREAKAQAEAIAKGIIAKKREYTELSPEETREIASKSVLRGFEQAMRGINGVTDYLPAIAFFIDEVIAENKREISRTPFLQKQIIVNEYLVKILSENQSKETPASLQSKEKLKQAKKRLEQAEDYADSYEYFVQRFLNLELSFVKTLAFIMEDSTVEILTGTGISREEIDEVAIGLKVILENLDLKTIRTQIESALEATEKLPEKED